MRAIKKAACVAAIIGVALLSAEQGYYDGD